MNPVEQLIVAACVELAASRGYSHAASRSVVMASVLVIDAAIWLGKTDPLAQLDWYERRRRAR